MTEHEMRMECLRRALDIAFHRTADDGPLTPEQVVNAATLFEAYVTRPTPTEADIEQVLNMAVGELRGQDAA